MWRILVVIGTVMIVGAGAIFALAARNPESNAKEPPILARTDDLRPQKGEPFKPPRMEGFMPRKGEEPRPPKAEGMFTIPDIQVDQSLLDHPAIQNRLLHGQISLCNLIDALWLEEGQLKEIIATLEPRMAEIGELADKTLYLNAHPEYSTAMEELKQALMAGVDPDEDLKHRVNQWHGPGHMTHLNFAALQREIAEEIMPILTENQLVLTGEYKQCLFNEDDPLHPERVGQASASGRGVTMLTRLRDVKRPEVREKLIEDGINRAIDHAMKATMFDVDPGNEATRLRGIIDEALALSDEEFTLRAQEYAEKLMLYHDAKDQMIADRYNLPLGAGMKDRTVEKIGQSMIIPGALEIFKAELAGRK